MLHYNSDGDSKSYAWNQKKLHLCFAMSLADLNGLQRGFSHLQQFTLPQLTRQQERRPLYSLMVLFGLQIPFLCIS